MNEITRWTTRVEAHRGQIAQTRTRMAARIDAEPLIDRFRAPSTSTVDPTLDALLAHITPSSHVLDVGGGAGRFALPLARRCRHVTVVEPAQPMVAALEADAERYGIRNLSVVAQRWEEAVVEPADIVLCAHVVYDVPEIDVFLRKLDACAKQELLILCHTHAPINELGPLWERVHYEPLAPLPALGQLLPVFWELNLYPDLTMLPPAGTEKVPSLDVARGMLRTLLFVEPRTRADQRLDGAIQELVEAVEGGYSFRGARPRRQGLLRLSAKHESDGAQLPSGAGTNSQDNEKTERPTGDFTKEDQL